MDAKRKVATVQMVKSFVDREGMVLANGCFDILHVGHTRYLEEAKAMGKTLIVGVNSDASMTRIKRPPMHKDTERAELVASLACVDYVVIFEDDRPLELLIKLWPEIYAKGGDYTLETIDPIVRQTAEAVGAKIRFTGLAEGYSTTAIMARVRKGKDGQRCETSSPRLSSS